jgi:hypothetical protein
MDEASPGKPVLTVALDVPSASILADQATIVQDLQFVMDGCKRLLAELAGPEDNRDPLMPLAIWTSAVIAYTRCFTKGGKRYGLTGEDVEKLPLQGAVMKFHKWILEERDRLTTHSANPFEVAQVAAALTPREKINRQVEGIMIFPTNQIVVSGVGVQQLGALASELAKQTADKMQEQQEVVLKDAQKLRLESLYELPSLGTWPPAPDTADDAGADGADAEGDAGQSEG